MITCTIGPGDMHIDMGIATAGVLVLTVLVLIDIKHYIHVNDIIR